MIKVSDYVQKFRLRWSKFRLIKFDIAQNCKKKKKKKKNKKKVPKFMTIIWYIYDLVEKPSHIWSY